MPKHLEVIPQRIIFALWLKKHHGERQMLSSLFFTLNYTDMKIARASRKVKSEDLDNPKMMDYVKIELLTALGLDEEGQKSVTFQVGREGSDFANDEATIVATYKGPGTVYKD